MEDKIVVIDGVEYVLYETYNTDLIQEGIDAFREGYNQGHDDGYSEGYEDAEREVK